MLTTAMLWIAQSTLGGLIALALPRLFRLTHPRWLVGWWGSVAGGVVLMPVLLGLVPTAPEASPVLVTVVETTAAALATETPVPLVAMPTALGATWLLGTATWLVWLRGGARRLRRQIAAGVPVDDPALDEARRLADLSAPCQVLAVAGIGPCAVGWSTPIVVVPPALREQPYEQRRSVYLHELLHVGRGDVARTWVDEAWRALWWWQPAVWWALARLRLAREQAVDADVVQRTGGVRDYVDALVWCSTLPSASTATLHAGSRRHVLVRRVALMCKGESMSRVRGALVIGAMLLAFGGVTGVMAYVAPVDITGPLALPSQDVQPGALERTAVTPSLDVPAPRRVRSVTPAWTPPADRAFSLRVHAVIDASGRVAEVRRVSTTASTPGLVAPPEAETAVLDAVRQWEFEAPLQAPMLIATDVVLGDATLLRVTRVQVGSRGRVLRVGGAIPPPTRIHSVPPVYPADAMAAKVRGVVAVECVIGIDGSVTDTTVVQSVPMLDQAAVDAVRQWRYTPTLLNGEPVPVIVTVTVNFTLK